MEISIVAAIAQNYAIGKNNNLLCRMPADMKMFRNLTTGHTVIMGRKTFESLPGGPLPDRKNIVISRTMTSPADKSYVVCNSLRQALQICENEDKVFIIGGAQIYSESIHIANNLYITWIKHSFDADTFFPEINFNEWNKVSEEQHPADVKNPFDYSFTKYIRKSKVK